MPLMRYEECLPLRSETAARGVSLQHRQHIRQFRYPIFHDPLQSLLNAFRDDIAA
jgi:hypothetical protein